MSHIITYRKKRFDPTKAVPSDIDIIDIAHALSMLCRANGHFPHFFSVARHCINCALEARARGYSERVQLGCLLHDASEAYLSDITRPVKHLLSGYLEIEKKLQGMIFDKYISPSLSEKERSQIYGIDDAMLYHEFLSIAGEKLSSDEPTLISDPNFSLEALGDTERRFLCLFEELSDNLMNKI